VSTAVASASSPAAAVTGTPPLPAPPVRRAVLSLGSNLGDREQTIRDAVADLAAIDAVTVAAASTLIETPAWKPEGIDTDAPAYLNAVVIVRTTLNPIALLDAINRIEAAHGRVRETRWGDRTLDIDIVTVGTMVQHSERLTLPHPRAADRAFVLAPWLEIDPDAALPGIGRVDALPAATDDTVQPYPAEALL
jgi:2-amino-4-hydroxy-6-hydroxymethyldihydropteridine diphosphokinase